MMDLLFLMLFFNLLFYRMPYAVSESRVVSSGSQRRSTRIATGGGQRVSSSTTVPRGAARSSQYYQCPTTHLYDKLWPCDFCSDCKKSAELRIARRGKG